MHETLHALLERMVTKIKKDGRIVKLPKDHRDMLEEFGYLSKL